MKSIRHVWPLVYVFCHLGACTKQASTTVNLKESSLDGVYGFGGIGEFESETIVLEGSRFHYWFRWCEPLPNMFPLSGTFVRRDNTLSLTYAIPGTEVDNFRSISPPTQIQLEEHSGLMTLRTVRFADPFSNDPGPPLFLTTIGLSEDRSKFPADVTEDKIALELREVARKLRNPEKD